MLDSLYSDAFLITVQSLIRTPLGQKKVSLLVRCPDFRECNVHKGVFGIAKCVLFIEVSSYEGVLNEIE